MKSINIVCGITWYKPLKLAMLLAQNVVLVQNAIYRADT